MSDFDRFHLLLHPKSYDQFEDIARAAAKLKWNNAAFTPHGRTGQRQAGVDIYVLGRPGGYVGVQCKNTRGGVTRKVIDNEVAKAEHFKPPLTEFWIATSASRNNVTQEHCRLLSSSRRLEGKFIVNMLFWEDIAEYLKEDVEVLYRHFPYLRPLAPVAQREVAESDERLFREFQDLLPDNPVMKSLRMQDFGEEFPMDLLMALHTFVSNWRSIDKEFYDSQVQQKLGEFLDIATAFCTLVHDYTNIVERVADDEAKCDPTAESSRSGQGSNPKWCVPKSFEEQSTAFSEVYEVKGMDHNLLWSSPRPQTREEYEQVGVASGVMAINDCSLLLDGLYGDLVRFCRTRGLGRTSTSPRRGFQGQLRDSRLLGEFDADHMFHDAMAFLEKESFETAFHQSKIEPLSKFLDNWSRADKGFGEAGLQLALSSLLHAIAYFEAEQGDKLSLVGEGFEYLSVFSDYPNVSHEHRSDRLKEATWLRKSAEEICSRYREFSTLAIGAINN